MTTLSPDASRRSSHRVPGAAVLGLLVLAVTLLVATPVAAHPFVRGGGEIPVDSSATITLDLAHGCGSEAEGTGQDTLEAALEVPSWLRVLAVAEHPAYRHDLEVVEGRIAVVTWSAVGPAEPAPAFELDVVATGTAGDAGYLAVFQGCADRSHRWIGTPDSPAEDPAINVRLTAADPDRPAPPETPTEQAPDESSSEEPGPGEPSPDEPIDADDADPDPEAADPDAASDGAVTEEDGSPAPTGAQGDQATGGDGGDGLVSALGGIGLLAAAIVAGLVVLARSRRGRRGTSPGTPS